MSIGTSALLRIMRGSPIVQVIVAVRLQPISHHSPGTGGTRRAPDARSRAWDSTPSSCASAPTARSCAWCSCPRRARRPASIRSPSPTCATGAGAHRAGREGHARLATGPGGAAAGGRAHAPGVRHADRGGPHGAAGADRLRGTGAAPARARARQDRTRAPTGRAGRCRPSRFVYALDDVHYLLPLADRLQEELARLGRLAWLEEELRGLAEAGALQRRPAEGLAAPEGPARSRPRALTPRAGAGGLARAQCHRARPPAWLDPRGNAYCARSCCRCRARREALEAIPEMPQGLVKRRGAELLALRRGGRDPATRRHRCRDARVPTR